MAASSLVGPQIVVAPDIGLGLSAQHQRLRCVEDRPGGPHRDVFRPAFPYNNNTLLPLSTGLRTPLLRIIRATGDPDLNELHDRYGQLAEQGCAERCGVVVP
jgi:hypothetical protein